VGAGSPDAPVCYHTCDNKTGAWWGPGHQTRRFVITRVITQGGDHTTPGYSRSRSGDAKTAYARYL